jgi:hypothetical protein
MGVLEVPSFEAVLPADGRERREHHRLRAEDLQWLRRARVKNGPDLFLVDISPGGALVDARVQMNPGSSVTLELAGAGPSIHVPSEVLRCGIASLNGPALYRGAFVFSEPIALEDLKRAHLGGGIDRVSAAVAWQKIVVRYREGGTLKGYTVDFHPSRGHFSLWPTVNAHARDRVIVPLGRLKALFFVRTFSGDPSHVGEDSFANATAGRKIEVMFFDREIVRGTTLNYRPDGIGFFITPLDKRGNNQRVFVVNSAIHQVRFP